MIGFDVDDSVLLPVALLDYSPSYFYVLVPRPILKDFTSSTGTLLPLQSTQHDKEDMRTINNYTPYTGTFVTL